MRLADFSLSVADLEPSTLVQLNIDKQEVHVVDITLGERSIVLVGDNKRKALTLEQFFMRTLKLPGSTRLTRVDTNNTPIELWGYRVLAEKHSISLK
jgi:hypothetical protein